MSLGKLGFQQRFYQMEGQSLDDNWKNAESRPVNQGRFRVIEGKQYEVTNQLERYLPFHSAQRIKGIILATVLSIGSLGLAPLLSKSVRELFTGRQVLRVLKEVPQQTGNEALNQTITNTNKQMQNLQQSNPNQQVSNQAVATVDQAKAKTVKAALSKALNTYISKYQPQTNAANLQAYSESPDYQRHARSACIYYNAKQMSPEDALRVVFQREPTNIAMGSDQYNKQELQKTFGYSQGVFNDSNAKKTDGSSFKDLPNTACIYSETYLWDPPGEKNKKEIACLSVPAPALDSSQQPHYKYYMEKGQLDVVKYEEEMKLLFKTIEMALRDHYKTAFDNKGLKRVVLSRFGQGAFLKAPELSSEDRLVANEAYKRQMKAFISRVQDTGVQVVMSEHFKPEPKNEWHKDMIYGDIVQAAQEGDLIINAWDPHSAPGNGNDADASFDGAMGKGSGILLTQTAWINEKLTQKEALVPVSV